jgi:hypothetical protein
MADTTLDNLISQLHVYTNDTPLTPIEFRT